MICVGAWRESNPRRPSHKTGPRFRPANSAKGESFKLSQASPCPPTPPQCARERLLGTVWAGGTIWREERADPAARERLIAHRFDAGAAIPPSLAPRPYPPRSAPPRSAPSPPRPRSAPPPPASGIPSHTSTHHSPAPQPLHSTLAPHPPTPRTAGAGGVGGGWSGVGEVRHSVPPGD
jgi:hypothetical protein